MITTDPADRADAEEATHPDAEAVDGKDVDAAHDVDASETDPPEDASEDPAGPGRRPSAVRLALVAGLVMTVVLGALAGWLGYRLQQSQQAGQERAEFVEVARQGAVNLTTIDWEHADADVQRILNSATGTFFDDFSKRSGPFIDVVKQVKSTSVGTVGLAGLESVTGDQAQVLVAVSVKTTNAGAPEAGPRAWRMRIDVQKAGNDVKVSNVEFVP